MNTPLMLGLAALVIILVAIALKAKSKKKPTRTGTKTTNKTTAPQETPPPTAPKIDIDGVLKQADVLIAKQQFDKAEALLNSTLNQDKSLHGLYPKLLKIYLLQDDNFAIKKLFETVQRQQLNTVYQQLTVQQDNYNSQKLAAEQAQTTSANAAVSPAIATLEAEKSLSFDESTPLQPSNDNTLSLDDLTPTQPKKLDENTLSFDDLTPTQPLSTSTEIPADNSLSFDDLTPTQPVSISTEKTADNSLDFESTTATATPAEPVLEFKFDARTATDPVLDFNNDKIPTSDAAVNLTSTTPQTTTLEFSLTEPQQPVEQQPIGQQPTSTIALAPTTAQTPTQTISPDSNDVLLKSFPQLAEIDPLTLNIQLAEHYIRLGQFEAAKNLLTEQPAQGEQADKIAILLQKIA